MKRLLILFMPLFVMVGCNEEGIKKTEKADIGKTTVYAEKKKNAYVDVNRLKQTVQQMKYTRKRTTLNQNNLEVKAAKTEIPNNSAKKESIPSTVVQSSKTNILKLLDAPLIAQMPELPRGCEVTSLAMMLGDAGITVDKLTLAKQIKRDPTPYRVKDGKVYFGNPNTGFVGDMYSFKTPGFGVYHGPIYELARKYLGNRVIDLTGQGFSAVEKQIDQGKSVWVINTSSFRTVPSSEWKTWYTPSGPIRITMHEHSVLITGYDDKYIYFNDPLNVVKNRKISRTHFVAGWQQFGGQAVSYK